MTKISFREVTTVVNNGSQRIGCVLRDSLKLGMPKHIGSYHTLILVTV